MGKQTKNPWRNSLKGLYKSNFQCLDAEVFCNEESLNTRIQKEVSTPDDLSVFTYS